MIPRSGTPLGPIVASGVAERGRRGGVVLEGGGVECRRGGGLLGLLLLLGVPALLTLTLPVTLIPLESHSLHSREATRFALGGDGVLEAFRKSFIVAEAECAVIPGGPSGVMVESEVVPDNVLVRGHAERGELTCGVALIVSRSKVCGDLVDESFSAGNPGVPPELGS